MNSVPTQTSIHARRVAVGSVCGADLAGRWSNSGRWWGFCQTAWLLTRLLLLFKADNQFASVQGGATQRCSEVENKENLKMCNQDCFFWLYQISGNHHHLAMGERLKHLNRDFGECRSPQVTRELQRTVGHFWFWDPLKSSDAGSHYKCLRTSILMFYHNVLHFPSIDVAKAGCGLWAFWLCRKYLHQHVLHLTSLISEYRK